MLEQELQDIELIEFHVKLMQMERDNYLPETEIGRSRQAIERYQAAAETVCCLRQIQAEAEKGVNSKIQARREIFLLDQIKKLKAQLAEARPIDQDAELKEEPDLDLLIECRKMMKDNRDLMEQVENQIRGAEGLEAENASLKERLTDSGNQCQALAEKLAEVVTENECLAADRKGQKGTVLGLLEEREKLEKQNALLEVENESLKERLSSALDWRSAMRGKIRHGENPPPPIGMRPSAPPAPPSPPPPPPPPPNDEVKEGEFTIGTNRREIDYYKARPIK